MRFRIRPSKGITGYFDLDMKRGFFSRWKYLTGSKDMNELQKMMDHMKTPVKYFNDFDEFRDN